MLAPSAIPILTLPLFQPYQADQMSGCPWRWFRDTAPVCPVHGQMAQEACSSVRCPTYCLVSNFQKLHLPMQE